MELFPTNRERSWNWTWPQIFIVVILLLAAIHLYRVNAVPPSTSDYPPPFKSTIGIVVDGQIIIPAEGFLSFKMDFNHRVTLKGWFAGGSKDNRLECLVLNKDDFELWKSGEEFKAVSRTGFIPGGRIERVLDSGTYYLIFDNRRTGQPEKPFETLFEIE